MKYLEYEETICGEPASALKDMFRSPYLLHNFILENKIFLEE